MKAIADYNKTEIFVAYNRRFFDSIIKARQIVNEDHGALYCRFDFTEASDQIEVLKTKQNIKENWLYANSTHVIDTVFHLIGCPKVALMKYLVQMNWIGIAVGLSFVGLAKAQQDVNSHIIAIGGCLEDGRLK